MAAVLSCSAETFLSHASLAAHLRLLPDRPHAPVHVSSMIWREPTPARRVHRLRAPLAPEDRSVHDTIPITTIPRLILDLAETEPADTLEHVVNEAHFTYGVTLESIRHAVARAPGRRGQRALNTLLRDYEDTPSLTRSELERALRAIARRAGLPKPTMNHPFGRWFIDAAYPDRKLAIEVDGRAGHSTPRNFERDRVKHNALVLDGWTVLRFTYRQVMHRGDDVAAQIVAAYAAAR